MASVQASNNTNALTHNARFICSGDLVIVYASRDKTPIPLTVTPGEFLTNAFGHFAHDDMVGLPYGSKILSKHRKGYVFLLRPTPELWTAALPHRTQILYAADMSFITIKLNLGPGSRVIEAGTGSGSFTHFLARTIGRGFDITSNVQIRRGQVFKNWKGLPNQLQVSSRVSAAANPENDDESPAPLSNVQKEQEQEQEQEQEESKPAIQVDDHVHENEGRLWSFEFHAGRAEKARAEFAAHGLNRVTVLTHRNVCKDGFGLADAADAIFLDLPAPWEAIPYAASALRRHVLGRICCFSPCIEQVLKTVAALSENGFTDIEMYESLVKTHESTASGPEVTVDEALERIKQVERRKEARRLVQIEKSRREKLGISATQDQHETTDSGIASGTGVSTCQAIKQNIIADQVAPEKTGDVEKKRKWDAIGSNHQTHDDRHLDADADANADDDDDDDNDDNDDATCQQPVITKKKARQLQIQKAQNQPFQPASTYSRPYHEMRGHTSYLTFATLLPRTVVQLGQN